MTPMRRNTNIAYTAARKRLRGSIMRSDFYNFDEFVNMYVNLQYNLLELPGFWKEKDKAHFQIQI